MKQIEIEIPDGAKQIVLLRDEELVRSEEQGKYHLSIQGGYALIQVEDDDEHDYRVEELNTYMQIQEQGKKTKDEGFALGMFVALQLMRDYGQEKLAKAYVECTGGIDFLEEHVEDDCEVDHDTIAWLKSEVFKPSDCLINKDAKAKQGMQEALNEAYGR